MTKSEGKQPPEFMQYLKQRDEALDSVKALEAELSDTQSRLYDAMKQIDDLSKKLKDSAKTTKPSSKKASTTKRASIPRMNSSGKITPSSNDSGDSNPAQMISSVSTTKSDDGGLYHPFISDMEPVSNSREYYWKIAEKFPTLPMYQILEAERKFVEYDTEGIGLIGIKGLDKALSDSVGMFLPKQLDEIFKEIDNDDSGNIDFQKVLYTMNRLFTRRKTNLPQSIQQNYNKICSIQ
ncbi:hypothetical protein ACF0H5_002735 [Mactra antiquata]